MPVALSPKMTPLIKSETAEISAGDPNLSIFWPQNSSGFGGPSPFPPAYLFITIAQSLRSLRKCYARRLSDSGIPRAKTPRR
jgi:hypothetical protein